MSFDVGFNGKRNIWSLQLSCTGLRNSVNNVPFYELYSVIILFVLRGISRVLSEYSHSLSSEIECFEINDFGKI